MDETTGRKKANKGAQRKSVLTVNGSIVVVRRWWHSASGSTAPADQFIDTEERSVSVGVREMACRLNNNSHNFDCTAENLDRTARIKMSGEHLRQLVIAEGLAVLRVQQTDNVPTAFKAQDCVVDPKQPAGKTRLYTGVDGVMVPLVTEVEKRLRRQNVLSKRRLRGRKCRPLPARKKGADRPYKEFKTIVFYDETGRHAHHVLLRVKRTAAGAAIRREGRRLNFALANERIGNVDGASWIRCQLEEYPLPLDGLGLDFYHLKENIQRCRRSVYGEDNTEGQIWMTNLLHVFKHQGFTAAWDQLVAWSGSFAAGIERRPLAS